MSISLGLDELVEKYRMEITGVLHIGIHKREEITLYDEYIDRKNMLLIDAKSVASAAENILKCRIKFNFINLDNQDIILNVLGSLGEYLHCVDYIYTKVDMSNLHNGCALLSGIDDYLKNFLFIRKELSMTGAFYTKGKRYISHNLGGGLGNQMFMIANVYALSLEYNLEPIFKKVDSMPSVLKRRPAYFDTIFKKLNVVNEKVYNKIKFERYDEGYQHYRKIELVLNKSYVFDGYFQSPKYFKKYFPQLIELFDIGQMNTIKKYYDNIKRNNTNTVSIHVRRGDYLQLSHFHTVLSLDYYKKAVTHFDDTSLFLVFSDDIEWCKNNFDDLDVKNIYFVENVPTTHVPSEIFELFLMSLCDHNIMANSSFSAWAAYLNTNPNKKVVAPKQWFVPDDANNNIKDIYDEGWIIS